MENFEFLQEIPIDASHTLFQITGRFKSVRDGLPELIKNSKDQYLRLGVESKKDRQIVVIVNTKDLTIGVVDFAGARISDFSGWQEWSGRTPEKEADNIEAGYGNGGKAFMVRGCSSFSFMESVFEGRRTCMGFETHHGEKEDDRYKPGFRKENGAVLKDVEEDQFLERFLGFLKQLKIMANHLPGCAMITFGKRKAFTGVLLSKVAEWENLPQKKVKKMAEGLEHVIASHGQTALTIETCEVWLVIDKKLITQTPISLTPLDPIPGFEGPFEYQIPKQLVDPNTNQKINFSVGKGEPNFLKLNTSNKNLCQGIHLPARNVIHIWNKSNNVAVPSVPSIGVQISTVRKIYGKLQCPLLVDEHLEGASRVHLADTPLTRALMVWVASKVEDLAAKIHKAQLKDIKPNERKQAKSVLEGFRDLMRKYLEKDMMIAKPMENEPGQEGQESEGEKQKRKAPEFGEKVDKIVLEAGKNLVSMASGTSIPLLYQCLETSDEGPEKPVKNAEIVLDSDPKGFAVLSKEGDLKAIKCGVGEIWLKTPDGKIQSNLIKMEVLESTGVDILVPSDPFLQGQRLKIPLSFHTPNGPRSDFFAEAWVDDPTLGVIGRGGFFTAGGKETSVTIRVKFGPEASHQETAIIEIGPDRVEIKGTGGQGGVDIPEILLCGDDAPGKEGMKKESRTLEGGEDEPTIIEEPHFPNVIWINPRSKEATRVRSSSGGSTGIGGIANKTFVQFIALKCFDILKRLYVRQELRGKEVNETQFIQQAYLAETQCADFIDAAWDLSEKLLKMDGKNESQKI